MYQKGIVFQPNSVTHYASPAQRLEAVARYGITAYVRLGIHVAAQIPLTVSLPISILVYPNFCHFHCMHIDLFSRKRARSALCSLNYD